MTNEQNWEEIVALGAEGGLIQIVGLCTETGWVFTGSSYNLNLNDDNEEIVEVGEARGVTKLERLLPYRIVHLHPFWVHDEFVDFFRQRLEGEIARLRARNREAFGEEAWDRILNDTKYREDTREIRRLTDE